MLHTNFKRTSASLAALAFCSVPGAALAQDAAQEDAAEASTQKESAFGNIIVVTAQKREENLRDVPVAVTAFSGATLDKLQITDASELVSITPGLSSGQQSGSNRNYFLRGVGTADFHLTAAPAVGQYFDGVTLTSGFHARAALFDMERVEILKGPQNTLFGLNTTGGAVNYISRKPEIGAGLTGNAKIKLGSDNLVGIDAALGFDLGTNIATRFAVHVNKHDGPFKSVTDGQDYGDDDLFGYRGTLLWEPSDRATVTLNFHGSTNENRGTAYNAVGTRAPDGSGNVCPEFTDSIINFSGATNCLSRTGGPNGEPATNPSVAGWTNITQNFGFEDLETFGYYAKFDYEFDFATLNLSYAHDNLDVRAAVDADGGPTVLTHIFQQDDRDTAQYEARLVSDDANRFRWIVGAFYLDESANSYTGIITPGIGGGVIIPNVQLAHTKDNLGIYGQAEFDFTDQLTLTAGLRWSDEEIVANYLPSRPNITANLRGLYFANEVNALVMAQATGAAGFDANGYEIARQIQKTTGNKDIGYTVKLDYKPNDDHLLYASHSKGFKGGAADIRAVFALVPVPNLTASLASNQLSPESLRTYEVGYKGSFMDRMVTLDISGFYYDYRNLQQFVTAGGVPTLGNAPKTEIYGVDGSVQFKSDGGFFLDVGFSLLSTEITDATGSTIFFEGAEIGFSPSFSLNALAAQEFYIGDNVLTLTANVTHKGRYASGTPTQGSRNLTNVGDQPAFTIVNANISYDFGSSQQFEIAAFANNLTNERFCNNIGTFEGNLALQNGISGGGLSYNTFCAVSRGSTRTFGGSLGVKF